jgi:hypothetical protein
MRFHHCLRCSLAVLLAAFAVFNLTAAEQHGKVQFGGLPVPGATVTAVQGDKKVVAVTDQMGGYSFPDLGEGVWSVQVEMQGFAPLKQDLTVAAGAPADATGPQFELKMLAMADMNAQTSAPVVTGAPPPAAGIVSAAPSPAAPAANAKGNGKSNGKAAAPGASSGAGFQRAEAQATAGAPAPDTAAAPAGDASQSSADLSQRASDGYLVNGSSVNGASSNFGLNPAIGNNRRGARSLYNGNIGFTNFGNSTLDARPYSLTGQDTPKPESTRFTGAASFGGPLRIPHILRNGPNYTINYQWTRNRTATTSTVQMPTQAERNGDFSQVLNPLTGQPVQIVDPKTGLPFAGNVVPSNRLSPQALALLNLYPLPNFTGTNGYNYQVALVSPTHQDSMQARANKQLGRKNSINGGFGFQSTRLDTPNGQGFGFLDATSVLGMQANVTWRHTFTPRLYGNFTFNFSRQSTRTTPFFQNRENISGAAGITGNNQDPINWGPPSVGFAGSGIAALSDGLPAFNRNMTNSGAYDGTWNHGRHNFSFGGDFRRVQFNSLGQSNPRGAFSFTSTDPTGYDFAGFLLGAPDTSSIAFGNADKYFRSYGTDAYVDDDWRVSPGLSLRLGVRWEYSSPITELYGRLVNLDIAQGFSAVKAVVANAPVGPLTGMTFPDSLVNPDKHAFQPRLGLSWRPISGSSMVVRAGYAVAYNTSVYQGIANQMAQQSPLSKSLLVPNSPDNPLTLASGFNASPNITTNNFAVDPNFRLGYVQTWQVSVQRDLPASLQILVTYLGNKGTRSLQTFYPNSYEGVNPCPLCPVGFRYLASNGNSTRESGSVQLRRRLHNGFTATLLYTYAKSIDDSAGLGGGGFGGGFAQNWLDLSAERARSSFDQRHQLQITPLQYTTGQGIGGGTLLSGWKGQLIKEWTFQDTFIVGTGLPLTPLYGTILGGTGVSGIRPDYTGASVYDGGAAGHFLNTGAYTKPSGEWGNAGRNTITGPAQFSMNATMTRTFRMSDRISLDLGIQANNVLNHVVYSGYVTNISSPTFGLASGVNGMRSVLTNLRMRF